jgi:N-acetylmuramoyl-L-alanine amidase
MRAALRFLFVVLAGLAAAQAWANAVTDIRVVGDPDRTRLVIDLEKRPEYNVFGLSNPYRLIVDLPQVDFGEPEEPGEGRGLISDFRYGLIAPGKARIVLDLAGPVKVVNAFVLDPAKSEPARLVVDLEPTDAEAFEAAALRNRQDGDRTTLVPAQPKRSEAGRPVVVIDPGHGGIDSGAMGDHGLVEKAVTLKFARALADELKAGGRLEPVLTRNSDVFLSLPERVELAQQRQAKLLISIHADTVKEDFVRGATVYTLSEDASDELAAALAERENRSDILAGLALEAQPDEVADILFDLARRETRNLSVRLAKALVEDMEGTFPLNVNPSRRASFRVLKSPEVPSVLLELGYLSNADDEALFRSESWPKKEAAVIADAIEEFVLGKVAAGQ